MNLLLLEDSDFIGSSRAIVSGRRLQHLLQVHKASVGDEIRVGHINGLIGHARLEKLSPSSAELDLHLHQPPPAGLPLTLIIALPRPKMIKRIFQTCATMGVKQLFLINSYKVEKSYWQSPLLEPSNIREQLLLGLEQGVDSVLPRVELKKRFKPFVEDELPTLCKGRRALLAHPGAVNPCPAAGLDPTVLIVGPEGGFIDYEVEKLRQAGCEDIHLGQRILRTETAIPVLLSRLFPVVA